MPSWPKWWETWAWNSRYLTQIPKAQMMSILLAAWDAILKQYLVHHFWILDCYSCNLCGVPHLWGELNVPRLGEIEWQWQANGIIGVKTLKGARVGKGPIWVMQMWGDLPAVGVNRNKIYQQPNAILLKLWRRLRPSSSLPSVGSIHSKRYRWFS